MYENINKDPTFAAEFTYIGSISEMAYPILISRHINCTLIEKKELEEMQKEFIGLYPNLKHLFKPSQEKNIFIPYHILAKYYLHIYTCESNFYCDMNKELKERKFDKYRIYIYLMYNALNKGIFKSYCDSNLYRGGTLSNKEFNSLMEKMDKKKKSKSKDEKIFFFSRKFLSFSKEEYVANEFLQIAIICEYTGVYVRFIVEGIKEGNYFVSNIDINEMKLSKFAEEKEVLFLPLSCFEVIDIETEIFCQKEIKVIRLRYLNQYKEIIDKKCEELSNNQNTEEISNFISNGIKSRYAEELCRCLDNQNKLHKKFLDEFSKKVNIDLNFQVGSRFLYKNSNPKGKKYSANKIFHGSSKKFLTEMLENHIKWLYTKLQSVQFGYYEGKECLIGFDFDGNLVYCDDFNCLNANCPNDRLGLPNTNIKIEKFIPKSDKIKADNLNCADIRKCVYKCKDKNNCLNEEGIPQQEFTEYMALKGFKKDYKQSGAIEATMFGNSIGHFIANFDEFKNADMENKLKIIGYSSMPLGFLLVKKIISITPIIKKTCANSIFKKGFFVISLFDMCRSFWEILSSETLNNKEKWTITKKRILGYGIDILCGQLGAEIGLQIASALSITWCPGMIIVGAISGFVFGFIGGKISNKITKEEKKKLFFYSDSLYYQYIPRKYREYAIPTLKWENVPINAKSYAIELIINEDGKNPSWQVINIPPKVLEYNEFSNEGEIIEKYKGIPENMFTGCFILYVFDIKTVDKNDFKAMKNGLKEGQKLSKHLIEYKILSIS